MPFPLNTIFPITPFSSFFSPNQCAVELKKEHGCLEVPPDPQAGCQVRLCTEKEPQEQSRDPECLSMLSGHSSLLESSLQS